MLTEDEDSLGRELESPGSLTEEPPDFPAAARFDVSFPLEELPSVVSSEYGKSGACGKEGISGLGDEEARGAIVGVRFRATSGG